MDAVSFAWLRGFKSASILTGFHGRKVSSFHAFSSTIEPRSGHDRASIVVLGRRRSTLDQVEVFPLHKTCDRGSISPRSRLDRARIAEFFHASSEPSDVDLKVAGGSRSLDRVNPDCKIRRPSDSISRWLEGHDRLIA